MLKTGKSAPEFTLPDSNEQPVSLTDLRGKTVVLAFYPKDSSPVCSMQMRSYAKEYHEFRKRGAEVIGISNDSAEAHRKFSENCGIDFPLLVDADKEVCKAYDAVNLFGMPKRIVYIIDGEGIIRHALTATSIAFIEAGELLERL